MKHDLKGIDNYEKEDLINRWIDNEKYRAILKRRLIDGIFYEPLAEEFKMSVRQVKNIVYKSERKLLPHIK